MLRRLAALAACAVLLAAAATGSLYVTTLPSGADVWIDGTYVGRSPMVADALSAGRHTVGLAMAGWTPQQVDVAIVAGQTTLSSTKLDRTGGKAAGSGTLAIRGVPVRAVYLDGVPVKPGKDGTFAASAGSHELAVRTPKGRMTRTITVWPATRTDVVLSPNVEPQRPSVLAPADVYVPANAIRIDGAKIVVRYRNHEIVARFGETVYKVDGKTVDYAEAPTQIGNRLYLPLELLAALSGRADRAPDPR